MVHGLVEVQHWGWNHSLILGAMAPPNKIILLKIIKKIIDLKFQTKFSNPKEFAQQQKLLIAKLKKIKSNQLQILPKTNNSNI